MSGAPPGRRGRTDRWAQHPALILAALVLTVVAGLTAVATFGFDLADRWGTSGPTPADATTSAPSVAPAGASTLVPPGSADPGPAGLSSCLDDRYRHVDCREPHRLERVDGPCSTAGMLAYMSGRAGTDVVLATVRPWSGACVIENPIAVAETAADALARGGDDVWRRCLDDRQGRLVPCSEDHTGEYIATGEARKATPEECDAAAEAYMRQPVAGVGDLLTVRVVAEVDPDPNAPRCLIAVRGSQPLTASVRNLGVSPVPIRR